MPNIQISTPSARVPVELVIKTEDDYGVGSGIFCIPIFYNRLKCLPRLLEGQYNFQGLFQAGF